MTDDRYRLTLYLHGERALDGWWGSEATARDKFRRRVGAVGSMPEPRVTLTDEETGETLTTWPDEA
ncbi:hypothetical protein AB0D42_18645 [Streptomyces sp. NPDC048304]|uniref:hypothetical protein n=1 Tax=Streptomyces sp. NPDC048304 TaxID=3154820 RepID=UPI0033EF1961